MAETWQSARLVYRALEKEDEPFLEMMGTDAEAFMNAAPFLPVPQGKKDAASFREFLDGKMLSALVCLQPPVTDPSTTNNEAPTKPIPIGLVNLSAPLPGQTHHRGSEIGVNIARSYQGQGFGIEAIRWAVSWGFRHAGLHRIQCNAFAYNTSAVKLYEKMGFTPEGRKRDFFWHDGQWWDMVLFSLVEDERRERFEGR